MSLLKKIWEKLFVGKSAAWTAIFTGVLMAFTILLYCVTNMTKNISITTQRAFIHFKGIDVGRLVTYGQGKKETGVECLIGGENSGTTPTKSGFVQRNFNVLSTKLPKRIGFEDITKLQKLPFVIGPKTRASTPVIVPIDYLIQVQQNKSYVFFWGYVTYHDVFIDTPKRLTEFCCEIINAGSTKPDMADLSGKIYWDWVPCEEHNCYDEDCPDYRDRIK